MLTNRVVLVSVGCVSVCVLGSVWFGIQRPNGPRADQWSGRVTAVNFTAMADGSKTTSAKEDDEEESEQERQIKFHKSNLGKVPTGWSVAKTGTGVGSEWKVVADKTAPGKTGYTLAQVAAGPNRLFNLCILSDWKKRDVEIEVRFKAVKGKIDQGGGIVWRYQDADNYYVTRMNPLEDNLRLYKVVNGKRTQLATKEGLKVPAGEWHTIAVDGIGAKIVVELDGKKLLKITDTTFRQAGKIGLWTKADAQTRFDNFEFE